MRCLAAALSLGLMGIPAIPAAAESPAEGPSSQEAAGALPASFIGKGLKVQLVSDCRTICPGQTFHLGLWLQHDPGYHTYWSNPGLAGVATQLLPTLPPGFKAGPLIYPSPDKVKMAGIRVHGYERNVLIAIPITAPVSLPEGPLVIPVEATWMCCQRTCNPGHARMSLTLATGPQPVAEAEWDPRFRELQKDQPPPASDWKFTAIRTGTEVLLKATPGERMTLPESPQFFSSDNLICSHPVQEWKQEGTGYSVQLKLSDFLPEDTSELRGILTGKGTWQSGHAIPAVSIAVPIQQKEE